MKPLCWLTHQLTGRDGAQPTALDKACKLFLSVPLWSQVSFGAHRTVSLQGGDVHGHIKEQRAEYSGAGCHGDAEQISSAEPPAAHAKTQEAARPGILLLCESVPDPVPPLYIFR